MRDDCIAVVLGLPKLNILWQRELEAHFEVTVMYRHDEATVPGVVRCPRCTIGGSTSGRNSIVDLPTTSQRDITA